jgi:SAM-dependent methyltransferase
MPDKNQGQFIMQESKIYPWIPFTALNTVCRKIDKKGKSLLDAGCGKGAPLQYLNRKGTYWAVGADIFEPYLRQCRIKLVHNDYVLCDISRLPFKDASFDIVLCLEVLEHLDRSQGEKLLKELERVACRQVILSTPAGRYEQTTYDANSYQEHRYCWHPAELKKLGYKVNGAGLRNLGGKAGIQSPFPTPLKWLVNLIWVLAGPLTYYFPPMAGDMVCVKSKVVV